jgi:hypothetical protein
LITITKQGSLVLQDSVDEETNKKFQKESSDIDLQEK